MKNFLKELNPKKLLRAFITTNLIILICLSFLLKSWIIGIIVAFIAGFYIALLIFEDDIEELEQLHNEAVEGWARALTISDALIQVLSDKERDQ